MIMPRGEPLLLPVNPVFIVASLAAGLAINLLPLGRVVWMPDVLMVLLVFWGVHQPLRIGMGVAFLLGLCMDVSQSALLGQHALAYTVLSFGAIAIHRRLLWFSVPSQALYLLNSDFAADKARAMARRLVDLFPSDTRTNLLARFNERVDYAWWLAFTRPPDLVEKRAAAEFFRKFAALGPNAVATSTAPAASGRRAAASATAFRQAADGKSALARSPWRKSTRTLPGASADQGEKPLSRAP